MTVCPHRFRHHYSHTWLDRGGPEGDLMELNGWTSPQMLRRSVPAPAAPAPAAPTTASWATAHNACLSAHSHPLPVMAFDRARAADKVTIMQDSALVVWRF